MCSDVLEQQRSGQLLDLTLVPLTISAGWDQGQCDDVTEPPKPTEAPGCPTWEGETPKCDVDPLPVVCTSDDENITTAEECGYYSPCFAAAAGYNVTTQCVNATVGSSVKCPMGSFPCTTAIKDTVYCGEYCNYENTCFAGTNPGYYLFFGCFVFSRLRKYNPEPIAF